MSDPNPVPDPFQALADPRRRQILEILASGPRDVGELARRCGLARPLVAHHLGVMQRAGLVQVRLRSAAVRPEQLEALRRYFDEALTAAAISSPHG